MNFLDHSSTAPYPEKPSMTLASANDGMWCGDTITEHIVLSKEEEEQLSEMRYKMRSMLLDAEMIQASVYSELIK